MKGRVAWRLVLLVGLAMSFARVSAAEDYQRALVEAVQAKERALEANDPELWRIALSKFRLVDAIRPTAEVQYEIGGVHAQLGETERALSAYHSALNLGLTSPARERAMRFIETHERRTSGTSTDSAAPDGVPAAPVPPPPPAAEPLDSAQEAAAPQEETTTEPSAAEADPAPTSGSTPANPAVDRDPDTATAAKRGGVHVPLMIFGGGLALAGGATLGISAWQINGHRKELEDNCAVADGPDGCEAARPGRREQAQFNVDSLVAWKGARVAGWTALAAGTAVFAAGVVKALTRHAPATTSAHYGRHPRIQTLFAPVPRGAVVSVIVHD